MTLTASLKALADEKRLRILRLLLNSDLCVGALAKQLGISKPAVSQHLQILRKAGIVKGEKKGYWTHYLVDRDALGEIAGEITALATREMPFGSVCGRINQTPVKSNQSKEVGMCQNCCQQPGKLMDKPENCSPEQIKECHGDAAQHVCIKEKPEPDPK